METRTIQTLEELRAIADAVLSQGISEAHAQVLTLSGDLGAGKTAFVKQLASCLGIQEEITSPTFVVMKSYAIPHHSVFKTLVHIDAYRIESDDEMRILRFEELLADPANLVAIEWPERIENLVPHDAHAITLSIKGETRVVSF